MFSVLLYRGENLAKFVKIREQVKTLDCVSNFY